MKERKKEQKPKRQDEDNRQQDTNTPTGGQHQAPGKAQEDPSRNNPPRPTDVDEDDEEMDRQRRSA